MAADAQMQLSEMWDANREHVRRTLIALARDIDLADDLLQETYLNARAGIESFRGGDARAWLCAIARNAFYTHARRKYVHAEVFSEELCDTAHQDQPDLAAGLELKRAVDGLSPKLRAALLMRHYAGYTYEEIANHLGCPIGTAKRRVNTAIRQLRAALSEEEETMQCTDLTDRALLDFIYGKLGGEIGRRVETHVQSCKPCKARARDIGKVLRALDAAEGDLKVTGITEIREDGCSTTYLFIRAINNTDKVMDVLTGNGPMEVVDYVLIGGEEARMEPAEPDESGPHFKLYPATPIRIGERVDMLTAIRTGESARRLDSGEWEMGHGKLMMDQDYVYVMAVRLPTGAQLTFASPDPSEVRRNGAVTVLWKNALPANKEFEFSLRYRLQESGMG